jgi:hypothetical protein
VRLFQEDLGGAKDRMSVKSVNETRFGERPTLMPATFELGSDRSESNPP